MKTLRIDIDALRPTHRLPTVRGVMTEWMFDPQRDGQATSRAGQSVDPNGQAYDVGAVGPLEYEDIAMMPDLGVKTVRCSVEHASLESEDEPRRWMDAGFARLDQLLAWYDSLGLQAIIDLHNALGRMGGGDPRLWRERDYQDRFIGVWEEIVRRYAGHPAVIAFEPLNEPEPPSDCRGEWNQLARRATEAIRRLDAHTTLIIDSIDYANPAAFAELEPTGDANTWYSFHWYGPSKFHCQRRPWLKDQGTYHYPDQYDGTWWDQDTIRQAWAPALAFRAEHGVKLFCGEFGCVSECPAMEDAVWLVDVVGLFDELGIDWTYFHYMFRTADPQWDGRFDCNLHMRHPQTGRLRTLTRKASLLEHLLKRRGRWVDARNAADANIHLSITQEETGALDLVIANRSRTESGEIELRIPEDSGHKVAVRTLDAEHGFQPGPVGEVEAGRVSIKLEPLAIRQMTIPALMSY